MQPPPPESQLCRPAASPAGALRTLDLSRASDPTHAPPASPLAPVFTPALRRRPPGSAAYRSGRPPSAEADVCCHASRDASPQSLPHPTDTLAVALCCPPPRGLCVPGRACVQFPTSANGGRASGTCSESFASGSDTAMAEARSGSVGGCDGDEWPRASAAGARGLPAGPAAESSTGGPLPNDATWSSRAPGAGLSDRPVLRDRSGDGSAALLRRPPACASGMDDGLRGAVGCVAEIAPAVRLLSPCLPVETLSDFRPWPSPLA